MGTSIIWDNLGLALLGVLACIVLVLLLPITIALRRSREERQRDSFRAREPSVYGDPYRDERYQRPDHGRYFSERGEEYGDWGDAPDADDDDVPAGVFGAGPRRKPRRLAVPTRSLWFAIGVCVGAAGLALWSSLPSINPVAALLALLDNRDPPAIAEQQQSRDNKVQDRFGTAGPVSRAPAAIGDGDGNGSDNGDVDKLVATFVANLRAQLPMEVGPGITMVSVDADSTSVAVGFAIAASVGEEDAVTLQNELEARFRTSVCAAPPAPDNIHGLNERGVAFIINYVDALGRNVAGLIVEPSYCSKRT